MDLEERYLRRATDETERSRDLVTLLFTDLVGSTERVARLGDRRWRELLTLHHAKVRELLDRFGGREVDNSGDGFFAAFDTASGAVRCGCEVTRALAEYDLDTGWASTPESASDWDPSTAAWRSMSRLEWFDWPELGRFWSPRP